MLRSRNDRKAFEIEAQLWNAQAQTQLRARAKSKEREFGLAELDVGLESARTAAMATDNDTSRRMFAETVSEMVEGARERGYLDAVQAKAAKRKWTQDYASSYLKMMPPDERLLLLEKGQGEAEFLDADVRDAMAKTAKREIAEGNALFAKEQERVRTENFNNAFNLIEAGGGSTSSIPQDQWASFTGSEKKALLGYSDYLLKGREPEFDLEAYNTITGLMADSQTEALAYLKANPDKFTRTDYKSFMEDLTKEPASYNGTQTLAQMAKGLVAELGLSDEKAGKFSRELNQSVMNYKRLNDGKEPDIYDLEKMADRLAIETYDSGWNIFESDRQAFEELDERLPELLEQFRERYGREPSDMDVARIRQLWLDSNE
jgi:hypothetical protein